MNDLISRQALCEYALNQKDKSVTPNDIMRFPSAQPERLTDDDFETIRIHLNAYKEKLCNQQRWEEANEYQRIIDRFMAFASAQPEIIRCKDCKYVGTDATCCLVCNREGMGLKPYHVYHDDFCSYAERKDLRELPSAQPEKRTEKRMETHACDLISRQVAMEEISKQQTYKMFEGEDTLYLDANDVGSVLASLPSAQPDISAYSDKLWKRAYERGKAEAQDEIVCCEDCKNRGDDDCPMRFIEWVEYDDDGYIEHDDIIHDYTKDDGFCDRAERRTDDTD